jgi:hypothetical protein
LADTDIIVRILAQTEGLSAAVESAKASLTSLVDTVGGITSGFVGVGEAIAGAFALDKVADFASRMAELGTQTERTAAMLGLTTETVSEFNLAAQLSGSSAESMSHSMVLLARNMEQAIGGAQRQRSAFTALGISSEFLRQHQNDLQGTIEKIAEAFQRTADGPAKTAIAMTLLGRAGAQMIPILDQGTEGLARVREMGERTGTILSDKTAKGMHETHEKMTELGAAVQGFGIALFERFKTVIDGVTTALTFLIEKMTNFIDRFASVDPLVALTAKLSEVEEKIKKAQVGTIDARTAVGAAWTGGVAPVQNVSQAVIEALEKEKAAILSEMGPLQQRNLELARAKLATPPKEALPDTMAAENAIKAEEAKAAALRALLGTEYSNYAAHQKAMVALGQESEAQETTNLKAQLEIRYEGEREVLQRQRALHGDDAAYVAKIDGELTTLHAKYEGDVQRLDDQAAEYSKRATEKGLADQQKLVEAQGALRIKQAEANAKLLGLTEEQLAKVLEGIYQQTFDAWKVIEDQKAVLAGADATKQEAIATEIADKQIQEQERVTEAMKRAADQQAAQQQKLISTMEGYWSSFVGDLESKNVTMGQAFLKVVVKMRDDFIAAVLKMLAEWALLGHTTTGTNLLGSIGSLFGGGGGLGGGGSAAATQQLTQALLGNTQSTAQNTSGIIGWIGKQIEAIAQFLGLTGATTAQTIATTADTGATTGLIPAVSLNWYWTAYLSGVISTGLIPAIAANTLALYATKAIPGLQTGTSFVPYTGTFRLHAGEIVIPPGPSQAIREGAAFAGNGAGGGGGMVTITHNWNVTVPDPQGLINLLQSPHVQRATNIAFERSIRNGRLSTMPGRLGFT